MLCKTSKKTVPTKMGKKKLVSPLEEKKGDTAENRQV